MMISSLEACSHPPCTISHIGIDANAGVTVQWRSGVSHGGQDDGKSAAAAGQDDGESAAAAGQDDGKSLY